MAVMARTSYEAAKVWSSVVLTSQLASPVDITMKTLMDSVHDFIVVVILKQMLASYGN